MANQSSDNNIYTVLALIALLALVCGAALIWMRSGVAFGTTGANPFSLKVAADILGGLLRF